MSRHSPEYKRERCDTCAYEDHDPDCTADEQLLDVWLPYAEGAEGCRLGLAEKDQNWVQLVLVGNEEQNGDAEREEQLCTTSVLGLGKHVETYEEALRLGVHVQEDERKADRKADPEDNKADDKSHKCRHRREVTERFGTQEARKGVLFHSTEDILLLRVEHVRNLRHDAHF